MKDNLNEEILRIQKLMDLNHNSKKNYGLTEQTLPQLPKEYDKFKPKTSTAKDDMKKFLDKTQSVSNLSEILKIKGPYNNDYSDSEGYNKTFENNIIQVSPNKDSFTSAFFVLENESETPITLLEISTNQPVGNIDLVYISNQKIIKGIPIKFTLNIKNKITWSDFFKENPLKNNIVTNKGLTKSNSDKFDYTNTNPTQRELLIKSEPTITIKTNLGILNFKFKYDYSETYKTMVKYLEMADSRKSVPGGKNVPEGFSPFDYDEFLTKLLELTKECPDLKKQYNTFLSEQVAAPINYDEIKFSDCEKKYEDLLNKYYNQKFPKGITEFDYSIWQRDKSIAKTKLTNFILNNPNYFANGKNVPWIQLEGVDKENFKKLINSKLTISPKLVGKDLITYDALELTPEIKKDLDKLISQVDSIDATYGYDYRNSFDKFMDSGWGILAQVGASVALAIAGSFTGGATWAVAAEILLNISIGIYQQSRGNTLDALLSFVFAGMSSLHKLYSKVFTAMKGIVRNEDEFVKLGLNISSKMTNVTLNSVQEINAFMKTLTKKEKNLFLEVIKTNPEILQKDIEKLAIDVAKAKNIGSQLNWYSASNLVNNTKRFGRNMATDMLVTFPVLEKSYELLKNYLKEKKGIDITFGEKDHENYKWIKENLTEEQKNILYLNVRKILDRLPKKELETYVEKLNSNAGLEEIKQLAINGELPESELKKKVDEINKKGKEEIENLKNSELVKKAIQPISPELRKAEMDSIKQLIKQEVERLKLQKNTNTSQFPENKM